MYEFPKIITNNVKEKLCYVLKMKILVNNAQYMGFPDGTSGK